MMIESSFSTGKVQLHYAEGGTQGKPVMVFIHGLTGHWQSYTSDFDAFGQDWHIYALDMRGHGKSSKPDVGYGLPDYAGDVSSFLREQVREPILLVGHSLGALVTLATAAAAPDTVRALIANDPPLLGTDLGIDDYPWAKMWFAWVYETMKAKPSLEQVLAACKAANPDAADADNQATAERVFGVAPGTVQVALENRQLEGYDLQAAIQSIQCPALLLYGDFEAGSVVREKDAQAFQKLSPQALVRKVPGGTHMLWWEQAQITRSFVDEFLRSLS